MIEKLNNKFNDIQTQGIVFILYTRILSRVYLTLNASFQYPLYINLLKPVRVRNKEGKQ